MSLRGNSHEQHLRLDRRCKRQAASRRRDLPFGPEGIHRPRRGLVVDLSRREAVAMAAGVLQLLQAPLRSAEEGLAHGFSHFCIIRSSAFFAH
jgi:hypothetical protein